MTELSDIDIKNGKSDRGFKKIYEHYSPYLWRVIVKTVNGNIPLAEQILQTTFIKVYKNLKKFRFQSAFSSWIYKIAWRESMTLLKKRGEKERKEVQFREEIASQEESCEIITKKEVIEILSILSPQERFLLISREVEKIPFEELSKIMGKSSGALRVSLGRVKEKIERRFGNEYQ